MRGNEASRRHYLLIAGSAGMSDLIGAYEDEEAARAAFIEVRLGHRDPADWAQLAAVPDEGGTRLLCWYGQESGRPPRPAPPPPKVVGPAVRPRRRFLGWWRRETSHRYLRLL